MSIQGLYNNFYQLLYGPNFLFLELFDFLQGPQIRSLQHLEEIFCQFNLGIPSRTPCPLL